VSGLLISIQLAHPVTKLLAGDCIHAMAGRLKWEDVLTAASAIPVLQHVLATLRTRNGRRYYGFADGVTMSGDYSGTVAMGGIIQAPEQVELAQADRVLAHQPVLPADADLCGVPPGALRVQAEYDADTAAAVRSAGTRAAHRRLHFFQKPKAREVFKSHFMRFINDFFERRTDAPIITRTTGS
jgi:hypothetical protein